MQNRQSRCAPQRKAVAKGSITKMNYGLISVGVPASVTPQRYPVINGVDEVLL
jgi:hypothetical protein